MRCQPEKKLSAINYVIYIAHVVEIGASEAYPDTDWYWSDEETAERAFVRTVRKAKCFDSFDEAEKTVKEFFGGQTGKAIGDPVIFAAIIEREFYSSDCALPTGNKLEMWLDTNDGSTMRKKITQTAGSTNIFWTAT